MSPFKSKSNSWNNSLHKRKLREEEADREEKKIRQARFVEASKSVPKDQVHIWASDYEERPIPDIPYSMAGRGLGAHFGALAASLDGYWSQNKKKLKKIKSRDHDPIMEGTAWDKADVREL